MRRIFFILFISWCAFRTAPASPEAKADSIKSAPSRPLAAFWYGDSSFCLGEAYGSFADILQWIPSGHFFDRGSVGQPAYGVLAAGTPSVLQVSFDGLLLNDPITGKVDLNWIPVEAVGRLEWFPLEHQFCGSDPAAQTLYLHAKDLSATPARSAVTYRTGGNDYDDIDVRFGLRVSRRLRINMGGILKNYAGTLTPQEKYRSQKANISLLRDLGRNWRAQYLLLRNRSELNLPLLQPLPSYPDLNRLHQQEARYDHGIVLEKENSFSSMLQITDLHREWYTRGLTQLAQQQDAEQILWRTRYQRSLAATLLQLGTDLRWLQWRHSDVGERRRSAIGGWMQLVHAFSAQWHLTTGLRLQRWNDNDWMGLPFMHGRFQSSPKCRWLFWGERALVPAGFEQRYSTGPFNRGRPDLRDSRYHLLGSALELSSTKAELFFAVSYSLIEDGIAAQYPPAATSPTWQDTVGCDSYGNNEQYRSAEIIPQFCNQPHHQQGAIDAAVEWRLSPWLTLKLKAKGMYFPKSPPQNWPSYAAQGYVQFHHRFFNHELDARLRLGCSVQGDLEAPLPYFSERSEQTVAIKSAFIPHLHAIFVIKDVTLFAAVQNPLNLRYQLVYPYPMPRGLFRWGLVWEFDN